MKKKFLSSLTILTLFVLIFLQFTSAEIIISEEPENLYNIGDILNFETKIIASQNINEFVQVLLVCPGAQTEMHKEFLILSSGDQKAIKSSFPLTKNFVGSTGECKVKVSLGNDFILSKEFTVTDVIHVDVGEFKKEYNPSESVFIKGTATKENGSPANGFVEFSMISEDNKVFNASDTIKNGIFSVNLTLPKDAKAGQYNSRIRVFEKQNDQETNNGAIDLTLRVLQVPTSIEIDSEKKEILPGEKIIVRAILHDQTGEEMKMNSIITIKDSKNKIIIQEGVETGEYVEYEIKKTELPSNWSIVAVSSKLSSEIKIQVLEKKSVALEVINKTLIITNDGNVPYNGNVSVQLGGEEFIIETNLNLGESKKYALSAPDGEYNIKIITDEGNDFSGNAILTGNAINVKEASEGIARIARHPMVWIFIIIILGLVIFFLYKKGYKRSLIGHIGGRDITQESKEMKITKPKTKLVEITNDAILSTSLKGEKQDSNIICLKIKNYHEILASKTPESKDGGVKPTLNSIVKFAESKNAHVMEAAESIVFILTPTSTKTIQNEKSALEIAKEIVKSIEKHNKFFKQKINFGVSITQGQIIAKKEGNILNFMAFGTFINKAKKFASISKGNAIIDEIIRGRLSSGIKVTKKEEDNTSFYEIDEIKELEDHSKFLNAFKRRLSEDK